MRLPPFIPRHALVAALASTAIALTTGCTGSRVARVHADPTDPPPVRLVAVTWRGEFFAEDPADGFLVPVGHTGFTRINSLTVTPDDRVVCVAEIEGDHPVLLEIDPDTGRGTVVCRLDRPADVRALAAAPTGMLYAILARPDDGFRASLAEIDAATGRVAVVMDYNVLGVQALEFCPHGDLFAFANTNRNTASGMPRPAAVVRIDLEDGSLGRVADVDTKHGVQSIAFDACDVGHLAWRPNTHLHEGPSPIAQTVVDPEARTITIADTVFDPAGADIRGIGFLGAHRWWEACGCDAELPVTNDQPAPISKEPAP